MDQNEMNIKRHGGPWDRGAADSYYQRQFNPHYFEGPTGATRRIPMVEMTEEQVEQYRQGYEENEASQSFKDYR